MSNDPYSPCICGSGRKMKFCCQDILADMQRIGKLLDNQPDAAEKALRSLYAKHQDKEVLAAQLASLLNQQGRYSEAKDLLVDFLKRHPDEPRVLLGLADICVTTDGFFASRRIVHRAFQLSARQYRDGVAMLASRIAGQLAQAGLAMAVREHLALAVRMSSGEMRNNMLMQLANFESQRSIPYPFRGRFELQPVDLDEAAKQEDERARKVSHIGCWEPAAILYNRLCDRYPTNAALWHNLGLCQAWDGRIGEAASSLHRAAELHSDPDTAAETEALAQLLDLEVTDRNYSVVQANVPVESISQLLTILDADDRFVRVPEPESDQAGPGLRVAAEYEILSSTLSDDKDSADVLADITIVDVVDSAATEVKGPMAWVVSLDSDSDKAVGLFREAAPEQVGKQEGEASKPQVVSRLPEICRPFDWKTHYAGNADTLASRQQDEQRLQKALESWLQIAQPALGDLTPLQAAEDESKRTALAGSLLVLDVICNRMGYDPDLSEIRSRLNLPEPAALEIGEERSITALPMLMFGRLDPEKLNDRQVIEFTNRITLIRHLRLLSAAVDELVKRPEALQQFSPMRAHLLRASVAREKNDLKLASECFAAARGAVEDDGDAFRARLELDIRELSCRLDDPADPELKDMLQAIRDQYFVKIPEIEGVIREELERSGCLHLMPELAHANASSDGGGLWTPDSAAAPAEGSGEKLWIPGQS